MSDITSTPAVANPAHNADLELRQQARRLEGVFMAQLYRAMRATVPQDGLVESSPGQELFTEMLDDQYAEVATTGKDSDLSRALYEQLRRRVGG